MKDLIRDMLKNGYTKEEIAEDLENNEINFNNADPTTHMKCYESWEIEELVEEVENEEV